MKSWVLIFGGTSQIGRRVALEWAQRGVPCLVAARHSEELNRVCLDVRLRTDTPAEPVVLSAEDLLREGTLPELLNGRRLAGIMYFWGDMGAEGHARNNSAAVQRTVSVNFTAAVVAIEQALPYIDPGGFIALGSSVAGDRGRASNYLYGATKSALNTLGQGLRHRLAREGRNISVTVLKLGQVDTRMTWGAKTPGRPADPRLVARQIVRAVLQRRGSVYIPGLWRILMVIIRSIPDALFAKLDL